jgi:hypothetical protein
MAEEASAGSNSTRVHIRRSRSIKRLKLITSYLPCSMTVYQNLPSIEKLFVGRFVGKAYTYARVCDK